MRDKDFAGCLDLLSKNLNPSIYFTTVPDTPRAATPDELFKASQKFSWANNPECFDVPLNAIKHALNNNDLLLICGSLYLIGYIRPQIRNLLQIY